MDYTKPVYQVDGKSFKSITGLFKHLTRKHNAASMSGIGSDRALKLYAPHPIGNVECARYTVSAPEVGKPMTLTYVEFA